MKFGGSTVGSFYRRSPNVVIAAAIFLLLYALLIMASPIEASAFLITNFVVLASTLAIASIGTSLILILGGFDLSVAGTISLTNVIAATAMAAHPKNAWLIAFLVICLGAIIGSINGFLIAGLGLPSLGVTLSTHIVLTGIALMIMPAPGGYVPPEFATVLTGGIGPIPIASIVLICFALLWILFTKTRTGMAVFAIGGDSHAARLSGISVKRIQTLSYSTAGAIYACAGLYFSALTGTGSPSSGNTFLLTAFAAAALGLVSFRGGRGSAIAAMFGAGTLTVIPKFLFAVGVADFWVGAFQGLIVLVALGIPALSVRIGALRRSKRAPSQRPALVGGLAK